MQDLIERLTTWYRYCDGKVGPRQWEQTNDIQILKAFKGRLLVSDASDSVHGAHAPSHKTQQSFIIEIS